MITGNGLKRASLIAVSILILMFEGFWLMGAYFFSDGRDPSVQTAIVLWCGAFFGAVLLWWLPILSALIFLLYSIARTAWAWPAWLHRTGVPAFLFNAAPDAVLIAVAMFAWRLRHVAGSQARSNSTRA